MGSYLSRNNDRVETIQDDSSLTFPPTTGPFFAPYYYMGNEKFETSEPENYLFGENSDLQYLGLKPQSFSYSLPTSNYLVQALKCLVNIRKDSVRLIRAPYSSHKQDEVISTSETAISDVNSGGKLYNLEFTFDSECPCSVKVYYNASEKIVNNEVIYTSSDDKKCSDLVHFNSGINQQFCLPTHLINPSNLHKNKSSPKWDFENIPIVIHITVQSSSQLGHSHIAYAVFEQAVDESWTIKLLKQKQMIDGTCYLIQEIYGIENKYKSKHEDEEADSDGCLDSDGDNTECVVCLSDMKDTIILPCKHLCLCNSCANQIRFQQSGCPICRQSFRALMQIRTIRKRSSDKLQNQQTNSAYNLDDQQDDSDLPPIPDDYEAIPLIEAINGSINSNNIPSSNASQTEVVEEVNLPKENCSVSSKDHFNSAKNKKKTISEEVTNISEVDSSRRRSSFQGSKKKKSKRRNVTKNRCSSVNEMSPSDLEAKNENAILHSDMKEKTVEDIASCSDEVHIEENLNQVVDSIK